MIHQFLQSLTGNSRDWKYFDAFRLKLLTDLLHRIIFLIPDRIDLICRNHLRSCSNFRIIGFQFFIDGIDILNGISSLRTGRIHDMDDYFCTFNMTQEIKAQADSLGSTLDQSRNICDHESISIQIYYTQVRT